MYIYIILPYRCDVMQLTVLYVSIIGVSDKTGFCDNEIYSSWKKTDVLCVCVHRVDIWFKGLMLYMT